MANDHFRKPYLFIAPIHDRLRGGAIPSYGVDRTYDTVVRLGGPRWACPGQSFSTSCDWRGHAKSGASPLPTLCQQWQNKK